MVCARHRKTTPHPFNHRLPQLALVERRQPIESKVDELVVKQRLLSQAQL